MNNIYKFINNFRTPDPITITQSFINLIGKSKKSYLCQSNRDDYANTTSILSVRYETDQ